MAVLELRVKDNLSSSYNYVSIRLIRVVNSHYKVTQTLHVAKKLSVSTDLYVGVSCKDRYEILDEYACRDIYSNLVELLNYTDKFIVTFNTGENTSYGATVLQVIIQEEIKKFAKRNKLWK